MQYDVHIYAVVRVKVAGVEAESQKQAIEVAEQEVDLHSMFTRLGGGKVECVEYAEDIDSFVVDEVGDEEYTNTGHYDKHGELLRGPSRVVIEVRGGLVEAVVSDVPLDVYLVDYDNMRECPEEFDISASDPDAVGADAVDTWINSAKDALEQEIKEAKECSA